jgi:hypothetical protein
MSVFGLNAGKQSSPPALVPAPTVSGLVLVALLLGALVARYATTSEVFLQPRCIPNFKEEDFSMGGGSDSTQRSSSECIPVVDCLF